MAIYHDRAEINAESITSLLSSDANNAGIVSLKERHDPLNVLADGSWDLYNYKGIGAVGFKNMVINTDYITHSNLENLISLEVMLQGGSDLRLGEVEVQNNDMSRLIVTSHMKNSRQTRFHRAEETYKGLGIWIEPIKLLDYFEMNLDGYSTSVSELLRVNCNRSLIFPITSAMKNIVEDVIHNDFIDGLKKQYLEAKITELLCHIFVCLKYPENAFNLKNQLSNSKAKAMKTLLALLDSNIRKPPSLDVLSAKVGMSKTLLTHTFKSSYGVNISEYITQKRLSSALELLNEGKLSILQVALEVGYKDQSSFGRAFKKFFGFSPLQALKH